MSDYIFNIKAYFAQLDYPSILKKTVLVIAIILAIPTTLVLASQNAVPGDATYHVKRGMENALLNIFSLHPSTRTIFKTDLSQRRFKEAIALLKKDDSQMASTSLVEMLAVTSSAADEINKIKDPVEKKKMQDDLSKKITEYRKSLASAQNTSKQTTVVVTPTQTQVLSPSLTPTGAQLPVQPSTQPTQPTPTQVSALCTETRRDYSRCGEKTHLLMIAEFTNTCTKVIRTAIVNDWDMKITCDPQIIGQCSASNIKACDEMLAILQQRLLQQAVLLPTVTSTLTPTKTPTPTPIKTPTNTPTQTSVPACKDTTRSYAQCGGTTGLEKKDPTHTFWVTETTLCSGEKKYSFEDAGIKEKKEEYPQCGGTNGLENFPKSHTIWVTRYTNECTGVSRYETKDSGNLGQCK